MFLFFSWHLQFLRSEFKGQLPKPYSSEPLATRIIPKDMNDMNKEEMSRYVSQSNFHMGPNNKKISVFRVTGLKILGRIGTHIFYFDYFFLEKKI